MKNLINRTIIFAACLLVFSASANAEIFTANLSSAQEVPSNASVATGYARVTLDESALTISWVIVFNNLSSSQTASHVHGPAAIGVNGPVLITTGNNNSTSGTLTGSSPITAQQIASMRAHQTYINVHSSNFPGGEIRGQLGVSRPIDNDGDGRTDFSVLRFPNVAPPGVAQITYWNLNSTEGVTTFPFGDANTDFPAPGDYDGDGETDYVLYRAGATAGAASRWYILRSSDNTVAVYAYGVNGDQAIARDYDGDGKTDLAIFRRGATATAQTTWWIRPSSAASGDVVVPFGVTGNGTTSFDTPVPGDYDGDGKFDIAIYRFGTAPANNFIILNSATNTVAFRPFGNFNTDYIVPGDYDGDGRYDLAAARTGATGTSPMVWWILQSSTNSAVVVPWGLSSDIPTQGDYDGDARTDIAIFRSNASTFWVRNSFSLTAAQIRWGNVGDFAVNTFDAR